MLNSKKVLKRIGGVALSAAVALSSMSAFAAGDITWRVKDYITTAPLSGTVGGGLGTGQGGPALTPAYEIIYEQYLNGVSTGLVISGTEAEEYGLKAYASSITRPVTWYDSSYPNLQYEEIWADGQYTGLVWPTGAQLPLTSYKDIRFMWEVGGTHKEVSKTHAFLNGSWYTDETYPIQYTGANADVDEENLYFGFDVFEVFEDGKARDVEVVLDKRGNNVNLPGVHASKDAMINAANDNDIYDGSITALVNSGSGVESVLYQILDATSIAATRADADGHTVPVYDFTGYSADFFDNKLPITHYFNLTGPTYDEDGAINGSVSINAYEDCVEANPVDDDFITDIPASGDWDYVVDMNRFNNYTNNIITTHATAKAVTDWVYAGYELAEPYRIYEYLAIEGIVFDGDIDNDGDFDTPVIFRYPTSGTANITALVGANGSTSGLFNPSVESYALADPNVEWRYAFVEAAYPHQIMAKKFVRNMAGEWVDTGDIRGTGKYAKENTVAVVNPTDGVESGAKHYQMRLEYMGEDGIFYVAPYDINMHAAGYIELTPSTATTEYLGAYVGTPAAAENLKPTVASVN